MEELMKTWKTLAEICCTHLVVADVLDVVGQVTPVCIFRYVGGEEASRVAVLDQAKKNIMEYVADPGMVWSPENNCFCVAKVWPSIKDGYH
jgi:hypothetical protein